MIFDVDKFVSEAKAVKQQYIKSKDLSALQKEVNKLSNAYGNCCGSGDYLITIAEEFIKKGDFEAGFVINKTVCESFDFVADDVTLYLRLAEYYLEKGEEENGVDFLIKLCTETVDNYDEAISFRELDTVWQKYKNLVEGKVPASLVTTAKVLSPDECTKQVSEILELPKDDVIFELYNHFCERTADGEEMYYLNKTEKNIFYSVEFIEMLNTEGLDAYLYERGNHFTSLRKAMTEIGMSKATDFLNIVERRFPRKAIPKKLETIQNALDKLEEKGIDFEEDYDFYLEEINNELMERTTDYVFSNQKKLK